VSALWISHGLAKDVDMVETIGYTLEEIQVAFEGPTLDTYTLERDLGNLDRPNVVDAKI
jgi:hypothetical protein